jgi:beta-glucosidase-like glycosyl hydrolase
VPGNFSFATSFPAPILSAAAFDDDLIAKIGAVVGREGRAFGNNGKFRNHSDPSASQYGFNFYLKVSLAAISGLPT